MVSRREGGGEEEILGGEEGKGEEGIRQEIRREIRRGKRGGGKEERGGKEKEMEDDEPTCKYSKTGLTLKGGKGGGGR